METKTCVTCLIGKSIEDFPFRDGHCRRGQCSRCRNKADIECKKRRYHSDPEYKAKVNKARLERAGQNRENTRKISRAGYRKASSNISDSYVRGLLAKSMGVSRKAVPADLIELQQANIKLQRVIRSVCNSSESNGIELEGIRN